MYLEQEVSQLRELSIQVAFSIPTIQQGLVFGPLPTIKLQFLHPHSAFRLLPAQSLKASISDGMGGGLLVPHGMSKHIGEGTISPERYEQVLEHHI